MTTTAGLTRATRSSSGERRRSRRWRGRAMAATGRRRRTGDGAGAGGRVRRRTFASATARATTPGARSALGFRRRSRGGWRRRRRSGVEDRAGVAAAATTTAAAIFAMKTLWLCVGASGVAVSASRRTRPHLHWLTWPGTRRLQAGHVQLAPAHAGHGGRLPMYRLPGAADTAGAGAPSRGGVSRRRRAGCDDTRAPCRPRAAFDRLPAQVDHFDARHEHHAPPARANRGAEIHVFQVHEVALVEQPRRPRRRARRTSRQAPLTQSGNCSLPRRRRVDAASRCFCRSSLSGTDHPAERQLRAPAGVHQPRPDDRDVGVAIEHLEQAIDGAGRHDRVAVEEQQVRAGARPDADVVPAREPEVRAGLDHPARRATAARPRRCRPTTRCRRR